VAQLETITVDRPGMGLVIINKADRRPTDKDPKPAAAADPAKGAKG
jgi:hypothetical protein